MPLYCWGSVREGKCGIGKESIKDKRSRFLNYPYRMATLDGAYIVDGAAGEAHTLLVDTYGCVYSFGRNREGQLGQQGSQKRSVVRSDSSERTSEKENQQTERKSRSNSEPSIDQRLSSLNQMNDSSSSSSLLQRSSKDAKKNFRIAPSRRSVDFPCRIAALKHEFIVKVTCGSYHSLAITQGGQVYAWGLLVVNANDGESSSSSVSQHGMTNNNLQTPLGYNPSRTLRDIVTNSENSYLQGDGTWENQEQTGESGVVRMKCTRKFHPEPKLMTSLIPYQIIQCSAGHGHTVALSDCGDVLVSGYNDRGQLGNGTRIASADFQVVHTLSEKSIVAIASGETHNVALDASGALWVWGSNSLGQLGIAKWILEGLKHLYPNRLDSLINNHHFVAQSISCGFHHSVAVGKDGRIFSWGHAEYDQHKGCFHRQQQFRNGNSALIFLSIPRRAINLENFVKPNRVLKVHCGRFYNVAITSNNQIVSWGYAERGVLGRTLLSSEDSLGYIKIKDIGNETSSQIRVIPGAEHCFCLVEGDESIIARDFLHMVTRQYQDSVVQSNDATHNTVTLRRMLSGEQKVSYDITFEVFEPVSKQKHTQKAVKLPDVTPLATKVKMDEVMTKDKFAQVRTLMEKKMRKLLVQQRDASELDEDTTILASSSKTANASRGKTPSHLFHGHRIIIETRCQRLAEIIRQQEEAQRADRLAQIQHQNFPPKAIQAPIISIPGVRQNVFRTIIEYIYSDRLGPIPSTFLKQVREVAIKWELPHLVYLVNRRLELEGLEKRTHTATKEKFAKSDSEGSSGESQARFVVRSTFENDMSTAVGEHRNADCIFTIDGTDIPVHVCILSRYSFFEKMLCGNFSESVMSKKRCYGEEEDVEEDDDYDQDEEDLANESNKVSVAFVDSYVELEEILMYAYTGSSKVISDSADILRLLLNAQKLGMEDLFLRTQSYIIGNLDRCDNIEKLLQFAEHFNFRILANASRNYAKRSTIKEEADSTPSPFILSLKNRIVNEIKSKIGRKDT